MIYAALKTCKGPACRSLRAHMSGLLDQELDPAKEVLARRHLGQCPRCAREYGEFAAVVKACREIPGQSLSRPCRERLRQVFRKWRSTKP